MFAGKVLIGGRQVGVCLGPVQSISTVIVAVFSVLTLLGSPAALAQPANGLLREVWEGIGGNDLDALTSSPDFPNRPTSTNYVTDYFEAPVDVLESYGQRMHGYVVAPLTGNYTFWISSDDQGALYLGTDDNPATARPIASVNGWTAPREWEWEPNQRSEPIALTAGKAYYISALMKEGGGGDNLAVRWLMPNGVDQAPMVATNLLPFGISFSPPTIAQPPTNTAAVEGTVARFRVSLGTVGPASFQWRRNGVALPAPNAPELEFGPVQLADDGARFSVLVTNNLGSVLSSEAVLRVTPDVTAPTIAGVLNVGTRTLRVTFSEPVEAATATAASNYGLGPTVNVSAARFGADTTTIELAVDGLVIGNTYSLAVGNVRDRALTPNPIAPNTRVTFMAVDYAPAAIGTPPVAGAAVPAEDGVTVSGSGEIGGRGDRFQFAYQQVTGNFDRRVRLAGFSPTDPFALAGLMARATLETNAVFAAALSTPGVVGTLMMHRPTPGATTVNAGTFPANGSETWLRLARAGNTFRAFAGYDGVTWTPLGSVNLSMPGTVFLGFAVASHDDVRAAVVDFREVGDATAGVAGTVPTRSRETTGPSSRHTPLVISEIMYHPRERADGRNTEFVELYNADLIDQDLTGHRLSGDIDYAFPDGLVLPAGGYVVVARQPADLATVYGLSGVLGPFASTNNLPNDRGTLRLRNPQGAVLLEVDYDRAAPWPASADGAGHSLVLARPSYGERDPRAWAASEAIGGSPGAFDARRPNPQADIVINEILAHTDLPQLDFLELYNHSNEAVDLGGCFLTDDPSTNRFRIPDGTRITPRGFLAFDETRLGFRLDAAGETVFLVNSNATRVIDAVRFGAQENGVSSGRSPDGSPEWSRLRAVTFAAENAPILPGPVVINEIHYAPISGDDDDEFVELHNPGTQPVDLSGWSMSDGVDYRFPPGATLSPGGYVVVGRNRNRLLERHPGLSPAIVFGNYGGSLANGGERLALARPDFIVVTNAVGLTETNRIDIEVVEVTYGTGGLWGKWSDGLGSSLELVDPRADPRRPSSWADSDESAKAPWTTIEFTGRVDNQAGNLTANRLHLLAQGPGEYLVDDLEVLVNGANRLAVGAFDGGLTGWTVQGNHRRSALSENGGVGGGRALLVRADGRGDTAVNRIRANLNPALAVNSTATLRAKVRWLRGWPEFLLRSLGSGIEAYGRLEVPSNPGTPGAPNSRAIPNAGPAVFDVAHAPVVPAGGQPVVVTARVSDPDGLESVTLRYRIDPNTATTSLAMRDDGTAGDAVAGDGVYSGTLPGRSSGTMVAFHVQAGDRHASPAVGRFPADAPDREALVRWGEITPFGNLGVYRLWQRQRDYDRLRQREPLANDNLDCTFVYGDERVIYNAEMRAKGSPWHGGSVGSDYIFAMPEGDRLLGARDVAVVTLGNLGSDPSAQREQAAFWIGRQLGIPTLHRRHVQFFENGGFRWLYEDTEEPNGLYVDDWFPEGRNGDLFKIEDWFEFNDAGNNFVFSSDATLQRFTTVDGNPKLARYRWAWRKRAVADSANDYSEFFQLVDAVNATGAAGTATVNGLVDMEAWMRVIALQHIVGNWDAYGYNRGKNCYAYLPVGGRWQLIPWDIDFVLGRDSDGPTADVFVTNEPIISRLWNVPVFRRMYWRAFQDAVNGPLSAERFDPLVDARYAALRAAGFEIESTTATKNYVRARRNYLIGRIAREDAPTLEIGTNQGADFTTANGLVTLTGTAPLAVASLEVNGAVYPVTWTTVTNWSLTLSLAAATNRLEIVGRDLRGRPVPGGSDSVTIRYTGPAIDPVGQVVIHEIQFDPPSRGGAFVEIFNASPTGAFDLSGWRLEGVDFEFPEGTLLGPGGFAVVAGDLAAFRAAYGTTVIPVGVYGGALQNNGERLKLVRPGATPGGDLVVDEVRYDGEFPWPTQTRGLGPSLQLIDARQDRRRPANWAAAQPGSSGAVTPGRANAFSAPLEPFPNLWLNEVVPQNTDGLADRFGEREPWVELYNAGTSPLDLSGLFLSGGTATNLTSWAFPVGTTLGPRQFLVVWCDAEPGESLPTELHTNFRPSGTNGLVVLSRLQSGVAVALDYLRYRDLPAGKGWGSVPDGAPLDRQLLHLTTPGAPNTASAPPTLVVVNEWMASNLGSVVDPADGDADDWFELHNAGPTPADLSAFTLTDNLAQPAKFRIPNGVTLPPGGFLLVWADEETGQSTNGQLHVNFRLSAGGEAIGLFAPDGAPVDAVNFGPQTDNVSQGRFPDGQDEPFLAMDFPTPGEPNAFATSNLPPVLAAIDDQGVEEGGTVVFRAAATDPDVGQRLDFGLVGAPAGASMDAVSGEFRWTTGEADGPGTYAFTVRVTDDGRPRRSASRGVTITVREVNQSPRVEAIADRTIDEGSNLNLAVTATDPDLPPQKLAFSLGPGAPVGATLHPESGAFSWTPTEDQGPGDYRLTVRVSDGATDGVGGLVAETAFRVTVREIDDPPVFDPVGLQVTNEGETFVLPLTARDPDPQPQALKFDLDQAPAGAGIDPSTGVFTWTPTEANGPGSYPVVVRATEPDGRFATTSFSIVVDEVNTPPELSAIADAEVVEGETVAFEAKATDVDLPAQRLTFRLEPGAPSEASIDPRTGAFVWPVGSDAGASTNRLTVTVTDDAIGARSASRTFTVVVRPRMRVVINEVHYAPPPSAPRSEFVELHNLSSVTPWNLEGWRLTGFDFSFPAGSVLGPGAYLVVARDLAAFRQAFGSAATVVGGAVPGWGTTEPIRIRLERPTAGGGRETVDDVGFLRDLPWPTSANGGGPSLQLVDAAQDNRRPANWAAAFGTTTQAPRNVVSLTNTWRYRQDGAAPADWRQPAFNDASWPSGRALLHVEDAALPGPKNTALVRTEGRMTYYFRTRFAFDGNPEGASLVFNVVIDDGAVLHLNGREIFRLGMEPSAAITDTTPANRTVGDATMEGPFTVPVTNLVVGDNTLAVEVHQVNAGSSDIVWGASVDVVEVRRDAATPGYANSVRATLEPFPDLWINEVLPRNTAGATDNMGDRDPWIELVNLGAHGLDLGGWWLTDDLSDLTRWPFSRPAEMAPASFQLVWADAEPLEQTPGSWHATFRLRDPRGAVALVRPQNGRPAVVDYLFYDVAAADQSFGSIAEMDPLTRGRLPAPTAGAPNAENRPPVLEALPRREATVGRTLAFDVRASDADAGQRLVFALAAGAPIGATLDPATGRFSWTPGAGQVGPSTIVVTVTDDGLPPATASGSFTVEVRDAETSEIRITGIVLGTDGAVQLAWTSIPGRNYVVEGTASLGEAWTAIGSLEAGGATATLTVAAPAGHHFFRVVRRP